MARLLEKNSAQDKERMLWLDSFYRHWIHGERDIRSYE